MTKTTPRRIGGILTALGVGAIAAIASFAHLRELAIAHGQSHMIGTLYPLSVDGLIICSTFALGGDKVVWPRIGFGVGVVATISGNILAVPGDTLSRVISAWPAVALLLVEILVPRAKRTAAVLPAEPEPVAPAVKAVTPTVEPAPKAPPRQPTKAAKTAQKVAKVAARTPGAPPAVIAAKVGVSETTVRRYLPGETPAINGSPIKPEPAEVTV